MKQILDYFGTELHEGDFVVYVRGYRNPELVTAKISKIAKTADSARTYIQILLAGRKFLYGREEGRPDLMYVVKPIPRRLFNLDKLIKIDESQLKPAERLVLVEGEVLEGIFTSPKEVKPWVYSVVKYPELTSAIDKLPYCW